MSSIPTNLRALVIERAGARCEYCLLPARAAFYSHEVDHVVARKHDGQTTAVNLAMACARCNQHKGSDLGSLDPETGNFAFFFNPRTQCWDDHFALDGPRIVPLTPEGRVTVAIFQLNHPDRLQERELLIAAGRYP
jgi:hypothetical protein